MAYKAKEEKEKQLCNISLPSNKWQPGITIPKEFNLQT
jgi:hypothetical protein